MKKIYIIIALLALYGDFVKRFLPEKTALTMLYVVALLLAVAIMKLFKDDTVQPELKNRKRDILNTSVTFLLIYYVVKMLMSYLAQDVRFSLSATAALYRIIPILYCFAILKKGPKFDLSRFASVCLILMIPINLIGIIQYSADPTFLISTEYVETGGIIERNLLVVGETFNRMPSIFVSADRYSGVALIQLLFTLVLIFAPGEKKTTNIIWIAYNLLSSNIALLIAGARSRILIAIVIYMVISGAIYIKAFRGRIGEYFKKLLDPKVIMLFAFVLLLILVFNLESIMNWAKDFPVLNFINETAKTGEIESRVGDTIRISAVKSDALLFGSGLGGEGRARPLEFGVRGIWLEHGIIGGIIVLILMLRIILVLGLIAFRAFKKGEPIKAAIFALPMLLFIFGLMAGLTVIYELSVGILLWVSIAGMINYEEKATNV